MRLEVFVIRITTMAFNLGVELLNSMWLRGVLSLMQLAVMVVSLSQPRFVRSFSTSTARSLTSLSSSVYSYVRLVTKCSQTLKPFVKCLKVRVSALKLTWNQALTKLLVLTHQINLPLSYSLSTVAWAWLASHLCVCCLTKVGRSPLWACYFPLWFSGDAIFSTVNFNDLQKYHFYASTSRFPTREASYHQKTFSKF